MGTKMLSQRRREIQAQSTEYAFYSVLLLPLAIIAVLTGRLLGQGRRYRSGTARRGSFFTDIMELNRATVPWIFMGR